MRTKIIEVVVNLISNAVKFTNEGEIVCRVVHQGDEIITSIKDSGIGIAKQDHEAVEDQQVGGDTLTDKPKGTGLGLPICRKSSNIMTGSGSKASRGRAVHFSLLCR